MKKQFFLLSSLCLVLTACGNINMTTPTDNKTSSTSESESESDRAITKKIRQALMDDDSLSTNAKNIKIKVNDAKVSLSGAVNSEREKSAIGKKAASVSGVKSVDNQLETIPTT